MINFEEKDKQLHFVVGSAITAWSSLFMGLEYAITIAVGIGLAKELYDRFNPKKHTADIADSNATSLGAFATAGLLLWFGV